MSTLRRALLPAVLFALLLSGCAARAHPPAASARSGRPLEIKEGLASYYGDAFHGRTMASGGRFDKNSMVAAHPSYPFGTVVRVTNVKNDRSQQVRILDRGPAPSARASGVVIDLSYGAARSLGFIREGRTRVRLEVLQWGS
jgi:rare lipoprotein A